MAQNDGELRDETGRPAEGVNGHAPGESLHDRVMEALRNVDDPELGINIVDLGLVYDLAVEDGTVHVTFTLTTMGCPIGPLIENQIRQFVEPLEGVDEVRAEMTMSPPWSPEKMSEEAKAALGMF